MYIVYVVGKSFYNCIAKILYHAFSHCVLQCCSQQPCLEPSKNAQMRRPRAACCSPYQRCVAHGPSHDEPEGHIMILHMLLRLRMVSEQARDEMQPTTKQNTTTIIFLRGNTINSALLLAASPSLLSNVAMRASMLLRSS